MRSALALYLAATFSTSQILINAFTFSTTIGHEVKQNVKETFLSRRVTSSIKPFNPSFSSTLYSSSSTDVSSSLLSLQLEKPLGLILEEVEENCPKGVKVEELSDAGSAYQSEFRDRLIGLKVVSVMGEDVTSIGFDDVMEKLIDAPSPLTIDFELPKVEGEGAVADGEEETPTVSFDIGTKVDIQVLQEGKDPVTIIGTVGENLRTTLLENKIELYRGLKKKLGNCGGGGQCLFCAVNFVESEGWDARCEYEETKLAKRGPDTVRLACINNICGPVTIQIQ